jgi:hypothetical protein
MVKFFAGDRGLGCEKPKHNRIFKQGEYEWRAESPLTKEYDGASLLN